MFLDDSLLDAMMFEHGISTLQGEEVRLEGWWNEHQLDVLSIADHDGNTIHQDLSEVAQLALEDVERLDQGQHRVIFRRILCLMLSDNHPSCGFGLNLK